jgi:hypothetical protein
MCVDRVVTKQRLRAVVTTDSRTDASVTRRGEGSDFDMWRVGREGYVRPSSGLVQVVAALTAEA